MNNNIKFFLILVVLMSGVYGQSIYSQTDKLRDDIRKIISTADGKVGAAIKFLDRGDTLTVNNDYKYPMQSVYKFPLAFAVLNMIDKGEYSLKHEIRLTKGELLPDTWSPLRDKYPEGNVDIPLSEILTYTVSLSDNNGCDILFRLLGGPGNVEEYIHGLGINDIAIISTEQEMHADYGLQYKNWCKPMAMVSLFELLNNGKHLSKESNDFLCKVLKETATGPNRIKGLLPEGTVVAHKTGSSGYNDKGIASATNDAGIVELPDGRKFAIAVFISDFKGDEKTCESIIAKISRLAWDYAVKK
ncbi:MAG: class A beta-lactamase, subclass A2 [Ignavibacteria bacterium]|nr:class A beta-lactamase, subclass A2 [Ignavibacteria bacterium]